MCVIFLRLWFCPVVVGIWMEWINAIARELHAGTESTCIFPHFPLGDEKCRRRLRVEWPTESPIVVCRISFSQAQETKEQQNGRDSKGQTTNLVIRRHVSILSLALGSKKKNEKRTRSEWTLKSAHQTSFARRTQRLAAA